VTRGFASKGARLGVLRTTVHHRPPAFLTSPNSRPAVTGEPS
jgi:hypothetical protein